MSGWLGVFRGIQLPNMAMNFNTIIDIVCCLILLLVFFFGFRSVLSKQAILLFPWWLHAERSTIIMIQLTSIDRHVAVKHHLYINDLALV